MMIFGLSRLIPTPIRNTVRSGCGALAPGLSVSAEPCRSASIASQSEIGDSPRS